MSCCQCAFTLFSLEGIITLALFFWEFPWAKMKRLSFTTLVHLKNKCYWSFVRMFRRFVRTHNEPIVNGTSGKQCLILKVIIKVQLNFLIECRTFVSHGQTTKIVVTCRCSVEMVSLFWMWRQWSQSHLVSNIKTVCKTSSGRVVNVDCKIIFRRLLSLVQSRRCTKTKQNIMMECLRYKQGTHLLL